MLRTLTLLQLILGLVWFHLEPYMPGYLTADELGCKHCTHSRLLNMSVHLRLNKNSEKV